MARVSICLIGKTDQCENLQENHPWIDEIANSVDLTIEAYTWRDQAVPALANSVHTYARQDFRDQLDTWPNWDHMPRMLHFTDDERKDVHLSQFYLLHQAAKHAQDSDLYIRLRSDSQYLSNHGISDVIVNYAQAFARYRENQPDAFTEFYWQTQFLKDHPEINCTVRDQAIMVADINYQIGGIGPINDQMFMFNTAQRSQFAQRSWLSKVFDAYRKLVNTANVFVGGDAVWTQTIPDTLLINQAIYTRIIK